MKKLLLAGALMLATIPAAHAGAADWLEQCNNPGPGEVDEDTTRDKFEQCLAITVRNRDERTPVTEEENFPDWIFRCDVRDSSINVYIYEHSQSNFTIRGALLPFQLDWSKEKYELVLTVENGKCELIYPVEQG